MIPFTEDLKLLLMGVSSKMGVNDTLTIDYIRYVLKDWLHFF